jgi:hypothetical protein
MAINIADLCSVATCKQVAAPLLTWYNKSRVLTHQAPMLIFSMMCYEQELIFFVGKEDSVQSGPW